MNTTVEIFLEKQWQPAASVSFVGDQVVFEYLPEYVFGDDPEPVALGLPVNMERTKASMPSARTPLAFLWDLVPQGPGRQHLAGLLGISDQDPSLDLALAQRGAYAPIGRLRLDTAVAFYREHADGRAIEGFTLTDLEARTDVLLDELKLHGMLAAGTTGVQGVAPKFLLNQDQGECWYPVGTLSDEAAHRHWIAKLPRGPHAADERILRHEWMFLQAGAHCGLRAIDDPIYCSGVLLLPRFDREVVAGEVMRLHQETLASLMGMPGFGRSASLFDLTERLAAVATNPAAEVTEFLCRDVLNRAMRNTDNHLRNTSVQQLADGTVQLTPLYDLSPMYLDPELVTRTCNWTGRTAGVANDWNHVLDLLKLDDTIKASVARGLQDFGKNQLAGLVEHLEILGADRDIVETCKIATHIQLAKLERVDVNAVS